MCSQVDLAEKIFHEGVSRGFYAKVSRLGTQWLELDLHFLSLGGGETALRWWFEKCLVPYLGNSKELAMVKSIDIVTGYGKTRARGMRKGDDSMRKRVRAMLSFMKVSEVTQPNLGRIHIDKEALMREVERNCGRILFDVNGYEQFKLQEGLDEPYSDTPQFVRPRGGAMHDRSKRDRQQEQSDCTAILHGGCSESSQDNHREKMQGDYSRWHDGYGDKGDSRATNPIFDIPTMRHSQLPQDNQQRHAHGNLSCQSPPSQASRYYSRKRPYHAAVGSNKSCSSVKDQDAQIFGSDNNHSGSGSSCYHQRNLSRNPHFYPHNNH